MIRRLVIVAAVVLGTFGWVTMQAASAQSSGPLSSDPFTVPQSPNSTTSDPFNLGSGSDGSGITGSGSAQQNGDLGVRVVLSDSRNRDSVALYNLGADTTHDYDLARSVTDALGVPRSRAHVHESSSNSDSFTDNTDSSDLTPADVKIAIDGRLTTRVNGTDWKFQTPTSALLRIAHQYDYSGLEFALCPSGVPVTDQSSTAPDDKIDGCSIWRVAVPAASSASTSASANAVTIAIVERPQPGKYWELVGIFAIVAAFLSIVAVIVTNLLRQASFKTIGSGTMAMSLVTLFVAFLASSVAMIVCAALQRPFTDFTLAHDLKVGATFVATILPAMLFAIPFLVSSVLFQRAAPPADVATPKVQPVSYGAYQQDWYQQPAYQSPGYQAPAWGQQQPGSWQPENQQSERAWQANQQTPQQPAGGWDWTPQQYQQAPPQPQAPVQPPTGPGLPGWLTGTAPQQGTQSPASSQQRPAPGAWPMPQAGPVPQPPSWNPQPTPEQTQPTPQPQPSAEQTPPVAPLEPSGESEQTDEQTDEQKTENPPQSPPPPANWNPPS